MDLEQLKEYVHTHDLAPVLPRDRRGKGFVCPVCGNGSGETGDGLSRIPLSNSYKCFKCGESGDAFYWIGRKFNADNFITQAEIASGLYGVPFDKPSAAPFGDGSAHDGGGVAPVLRNLSVPVPAPDDKEAAEYIARCAGRADGTDYFRRRGLSDELVGRFRLGYDPSFSEGTGGRVWQAVVIPTSDTTYEARNIGVLPNSKEGASNKCRKHGRTVLFNGEALETEQEKPIFITEGSIDALSIIECGGQAVALGGVSNTGLLLTKLESVTPSVPLIPVLDCDDAGRTAAAKLAAELEKRGIPFADASAELMGGFHDPNDRLMKDRNGLAAAVEEISGRVMAEVRSPAEKQREEYLRSSVYYAVGDFKEFIRRSAERPAMKTGLIKVDEALGGGLYTGLYVLGAVSSLGKTTFALQIADFIALSGTDVLFFSLEQSRFELMSKSISRESFVACIRNNIDTRYARTALNIINGRNIPDGSDGTDEFIYNSAFSNYRRYTDRLFIYEGIGNISVAEIRQKVRDHITFTGNARPVVFIDYLQILKAAEGDERATDKQITDRNITALKQLSRDFDIPVFAVSSLNRQNYSERINMAAFKESGAIEYGSDVLLGLQLKGAGEQGFDITAAKARDPREVELFVLKNRSGAVTAKGIDINYYPMFNCFRVPMT